MEGEPFATHIAKAMIRKIVEHGVLKFSANARDEMSQENPPLDELDITNLLLGGRIADPPEMQRGTWRYRIRNQRTVAVVAFRSASECVVVTAWKIKR